MDAHGEYPKFNFTGGLQIFGEKAFVRLANHYIPSIDINLQWGTVTLDNVVSLRKNIYLREGIYMDYIPLDIETVNITANQPQGNICINGPYVNRTSNGTCQIIEQNKATSLISTTCTVKARMCRLKTCKGLIQGVVNATVIDGQIQLFYDDDTQISPPQWISRNSQDPVNLTMNSYLILNATKAGFVTQPDINQVAKLQFIGATYMNTWLYTNKKVYFQAQYWPLIWASVGLLTPGIYSEKLLFIDNQCPSRRKELSVDSEISSFIADMFPLQDSSDVAFTKGRTEFYRVIVNSYGEPEYQQITIQENQLLIAAFALSAVMAFVFAVISVVASYFIYVYAKESYQSYVRKRMEMSITIQLVKAREENQTSIDDTILKQLAESKTTYEHRGFLYSNFVVNGSEIQNKKLAFSFSLYQIPTMFVDYQFRQLASSLVQFVQSVTIDEGYFTQKRLDDPDKVPVSMPLYEFQQIYSRFCNINGFLEVPSVEDDTAINILSILGLKIITYEDMLVDCYSNIRLKNANEILATVIPFDKFQSMNSIQKFLQMKCQSTRFKTDVITFEQMQMEYNDFCQNMTIEYSDRVQILGCQDLINFGAVISETIPPKRVFGIKKLRNTKKKAKTEIDNIVRKSQPIESKLRSWFLSSDGIIVNVIVALIHWIMILAVPLLCPLISIFVLVLRTVLQEDVFAKTVYLTDFFYVSRMDPWWNNVPDLRIVVEIHSFVLVYLVFAYAEIISYYLTGYKNNGKFPIMYRPNRRVIMIGFYVGVAFFLFLYLLYIFFAVQWCVLEAIFNPTVILPYAAAVLAFVVTVGGKIQFYKSKLQHMDEELELILKEKIGQLLLKSIEMIKKNMDENFASMLPEFTEENAREAIDKGMQQVLELDRGPADGKSFSVQDQVENSDEYGQASIMNNSSALATLISSQVEGLDPSIIDLIIGVVTKNDALIRQATQALSSFLYLDPEVIQSFIQLGMCQINKDSGNSEKSKGFILSAVKHLFRTLLHMNQDIQKNIGKICQVAIDGDPQPILDLITTDFGKFRQDIVQTYLDKDKPKYEKDKKEEEKKVSSLPEIAKQPEEVNVKPVVKTQEELKVEEEKLKEANEFADEAEKVIKNALGLVVTAIKNKSGSYDGEFQAKASELLGSSYPEEDGIETTMKMLLNLRDGNIQDLVNEKCYTHVLSERAGGILGFHEAYPLLFKVDQYQKATSLSNEVIVCAKKEIMIQMDFKGIMPADSHDIPQQLKDDRKDLVDQYNTERQIYTIPEKIFLSLVKLARGDSIDLACIAKKINALNLNSQNNPLDSYYLKHMSKVSNFSPEDFDMVLQKLEIIQYKDLLMEIYYILSSRVTQCPVIAKKMNLSMPIGNNFYPLVLIAKTLLEYSIKREDYLQKVKDYEEKKNPYPAASVADSVRKSQVQPANQSKPEEASKKYSKGNVSIKGGQDILEKSGLMQGHQFSDGPQFDSVQPQKQTKDQAKPPVSQPVNPSIPLPPGEKSEEQKIKEFAAMMIKDTITDLIPLLELIQHMDGFDFKDDVTDIQYNQLIKNNRDLKLTEQQLAKINGLELEKIKPSENDANNNKDPIQKDLQNQQEEQDFYSTGTKYKAALQKLIRDDIDSSVVHAKFFQGLLAKITGLWNLKPEDVKDEIQLALRLAPLILRIQGMIDRQNKDFKESLVFVATSIEFDPNMLEFFIDLIYGDPCDIFKVKRGKEHSDIKYDLTNQDKCSLFQYNMDHQRLALIQKIAEGSNESLGHLFLHWYHAYNMIQIANQTVNQEYRNQLGISKLFLDMVNVQLDINSLDSVDEFKNRNLKALINAFLKDQIQRIGDRNLKKMNVEKDLYFKVSDDFYGGYNQDQLDAKQGNAESNIKILKTLTDFFNKMSDSTLNTIIGNSKDDKDAYTLIRGYMKMSKHQNMIELLNMILDSALYLYPKDSSSQTSGTRQELISLQLLFNASAVSFIQQDESFSSLEYRKLIEQLQNPCFCPIGKDFQMDQGDEKHLVESLLTKGYMDTVVYKLMRPVIGQLKPYYRVESKIRSEVPNRAMMNLSRSVMQALLGHQLHNISMLRSSIIAMCENKQLERGLIEGFLGIMLRDTESSSSIEALSHPLDIQGSTLVSLMKLAEQNKEAMFQVCLRLSKVSCSPSIANVIATFLSVRVGDLAQIKPLQRLIGVSSQYFIPVIAMALDIDHPEVFLQHYSALKRVVKGTTEESVKRFVELMSGKVNKVLTKPRDYLRDSGLKLAKSLYPIIHFGYKVGQDQVSLKDQKRFQFSLRDEIRFIAWKMFKNFRPKEPEAEVDQVVPGQEVILDKIAQAKKIKEKIDKLARVQQNSELDKKEKAAKLIISACWGDQSSLKQILTLIKSADPQPELWGKLDSVTFKSKDGQTDFLRHCLKRVYKFYRNERQQIQDSKCKSLKLIQEELLPKLHEKGVIRKDIVLTEVEAIQGKIFEQIVKENKVIQDLKTGMVKTLIKMQPELAEIIESESHNFLQLIAKIGCTFMYTGTTKIVQPMFIDPSKHNQQPMCLFCKLLEPKDTQTFTLIKDTDTHVRSICLYAFEHSFEKTSPTEEEGEETKDDDQIINSHNFNLVQYKRVSSANTNVIGFKEYMSTSEADLNNYTLQEFIKDFRSVKDLQVEFDAGEQRLIDEGFHLCFSHQTKGQQQFDPNRVLRNLDVDDIEDQIIIQKDHVHEAEYLNLENIILLSFGIVTDQFMRVILYQNKDEISYEIEHQKARIKDDTVREKVPETFNNNLIKEYQHMQTLVSICTNDLEILDGNFMPEMFEDIPIGANYMHNHDSYIKLMLLYHGGNIDLGEDVKAHSKDHHYNLYVNIFKDSFGGDWQTMAALHKAMSLKIYDLQAVLAQTKTDEAGFDTAPSMIMALFTDKLSMATKNLDVMQGLLAVMSMNDQTSAVGLTKLFKSLNIQDQKATVYTQLLQLKDVNYLIRLFNGAGFPKIFLEIFVEGLVGHQDDSERFITMIAKYIARAHKSALKSTPSSKLVNVQVDWLTEDAKNFKNEPFQNIEKQIVFYMSRLLEQVAGEYNEEDNKNIPYLFKAMNLFDTSRLTKAQVFDDIKATFLKLHNINDTQVVSMTYIDQWVEPKWVRKAFYQSKDYIDKSKSKILVTNIIFEAIQIINVKALRSLCISIENDSMDKYLSKLEHIRNNYVNAHDETHVQEIVRNILKKIPTDKLSDDQELFPKLLVDAIDNSDIVSASLLIDMLSVHIRDSRLHSFIGFITSGLTNDFGEQTDILNIFNRELSRLYEYSIRKEYDTTYKEQDPKSPFEIKLEESIIVHKHGLLFGVSISDNESVTSWFTPTLQQILEESVLPSFPPRHWQKIENILDNRNQEIDFFSVSTSLFNDQLFNQAVHHEKGFMNMIFIQLKNLKIVNQLASKMFKKYALPKSVEEEVQTIVGTDFDVKLFRRQVQQSLLALLKQKGEQAFNLLELFKDTAETEKRKQEFASELGAKNLLQSDKVYAKGSIEDKKAIDITKIVITKASKYLERFMIELKIAIQADVLESIFGIMSQTGEFLKNNGAGEMDLTPIIHIFEHYILGMLEFNQTVQQTSQIILHIAKKEYSKAADNIGPFLELLLPKERSEILVPLLKEWLKVIQIMVECDVKESSEDFIATIGAALDLTNDYITSLKLPQDHILSKLTGQMEIIKAVLAGVISICNRDFEGLEPLAILFGGMPEKEGLLILKQAMQIIEANKEGVSVYIGRQNGGKNPETISEATSNKNPDAGFIEKLIAKGLEDPSLLMEPKTFFEIFGNDKGTIGVEEFGNIFQQLHIDIPHAAVLQIFAIADANKNGELQYLEFVGALKGIKDTIKRKIFDDLGFSIMTLVWAVLGTVLILVGEFAFLFIAMAAFSPNTTFSSVINSILALVATLTAKGDDSKKDVTSEELQEINIKDTKSSLV